MSVRSRERWNPRKRGVSIWGHFSLLRCLFLIWSLPGLWLVPALAGLNDLQLRTLDGISRDKFTTRWIELSTNELASARRRAEGYLDGIRDHHLVDGLVVSVRYTDRTRSQVDRYENLADSALATGLLLETHAIRFSTTRDDRESIHGNPSLPAIRQLLTGVESLIHASGREGYLARFVGRADDPAYKPTYERFGGPDPKRPGFGRLAYRGTNGTTPVVWLGEPSREAYAAINLGLASTWQQVRDASIRNRASNIVCRILKRISDDGWQLNDGQGHVTFLTPSLTAALLRSGATIRPDLYGRLFESKIPDLLAQPAPGVVRYGENRAGVFNMLNLFSLWHFDTNVTRKIQYQDRLSQMWRESSSHLNPLLAISFVSCFDRPPNEPTALAVIQGAIAQFPDPPRWSSFQEGSASTNRPTIKVNEEVWSRYALPYDLRPVAPFQWAQSSYLIRGGEDAPIVHPGVDYLLLFWLGRESSMVQPEDAVTQVVSPLRLSRPNRSSGRTNLYSRTNSFLSNTNRALRPRLGP